METFVDIAEWARYKEPWLRRFLRLEHGVPSHDTMNRVFRLLDPKSFEAAFRAWVAETLPGFGQTQIAIDGKSIRGAAAQRNPIHLVSAFATGTGIVFAQQGVADKGSETAAIPELLRALEIRGCLVSLDALGCQREIAEVIRERKADYLLAVKGNQPKLKKALEQAFADDPDVPFHGHEQKGHGRRSLQMAQVIPNSGQVDLSLWSDCQSLARIRSIRRETNKPEQFETRYYISSARFDAETLALAVRRHRAIENELHWRLDVTLSEDACTVRRDHAPQNLSILGA
jgi:predicted transposase YbfD/YdcC